MTTDRAYDFLFRADLFRASMRCMSTEETRYYLNGIAIQPHPESGVYLVATDGHRMSVMHDPRGYASRSAIFRPTLKPAEYKPGAKEGDLFITAKLKPGSDGAAAYGLASSVLREYPSDGRNPLALEYLPGELDPEYPGWDATARKLNVLEEIDGSFPDWTRVVPDIWEQEAAASNFNSRYVEDIIAARKDMERTAKRTELDTWHTPPMRVTTNGINGAPCLFQFPDAPFAVFVLMSMRDNCPRQRPSWLFPAPAETAEAESAAAE